MSDILTIAQLAFAGWVLFGYYSGCVYRWTLWLVQTWRLRWSISLLRMRPSSHLARWEAILS